MVRATDFRDITKQGEFCLSYVRVTKKPQGFRCQAWSNRPLDSFFSDDYGNELFEGSSLLSFLGG